MNRTRILLALAIFGSPCGLVVSSRAGRPGQLLHSFAGGIADGSAPIAPLTLSGNSLYGTTLLGGGSGAGLGTVFTINSDGSGYQVLHKFTGGASDGSGPHSGVAMIGSTLYGTTTNGGANNRGALYSIHADGTNFQILHTFVGGTSDGTNPWGGLTLAGNKLFGTAESGGASNFGIIYSINPDGTGFQIVHSFGGGLSGVDPVSSLIVSGSTIYGATLQGGNSIWGTVYSMSTDGTNFQILHSFSGGTSDGRIPFGDLTLSGSKLFGTTSSAGPSNGGTVFSINTDGTGYHTIHNFGSPADEFGPAGGVSLIGGSLIGTTQVGGGGGGSGVIFLMHTDGTSYHVLHANSGAPDDLSIMQSDLTVDGNLVYGMSENGGQFNRGTIFVMTVPEPSSYALALIGFATLAVWSRQARHR